MRRHIALLLVFAFAVTACGAKGAEEASNGSGTNAATTAPGGSGGAEDGKFGSLDSPCGPGDATVKADEAGRGTDKLYVGVANDRDSIRPGLLKEMWDGMLGFVAWCNAQGGVAGLPLEAVDLDGKVLQVEAAMATACTSVFAMVGGGYAQDNNIFSGKDGSDFHKCRMIAIPGFAVSTELAEATDQVQPLPNPPHQKPTNTFEGLAELYPEKVKNYGVVYGNLPSIRQNKDQTIGVAKQVDGYGNFAEIEYEAILSQDWGVLAQQVIDKDLELVSFVGEPANLSKFSQALKDQQWDGIITADANQYDARLLDSSGPAAVEGVTVRLQQHPYEEAADWPATEQFMEIMDEYVPGWQRAALAVQSFSAGLLFATSAKKCADDDGEISRACVLTNAQDTHEWDAGGLHPVADPGANETPGCGMLVQVQNGVWTRIFPELGSDFDDGEGFYCSGLVEVEGDFGEGNRDSSILDG